MKWRSSKRREEINFLLFLSLSCLPMRYVREKKAEELKEGKIKIKLWRQHRIDDLTHGLLSFFYTRGSKCSTFFGFWCVETLKSFSWNWSYYFLISKREFFTKWKELENRFSSWTVKSFAINQKIIKKKHRKSIFILLFLKSQEAQSERHEKIFIVLISEERRPAASQFHDGMKSY